VAAYVPFLTFYAIMLHANVSWTFGPLRNVFASPTFHRWHHTSEDLALNKNFAGLFPVFDRLFGTLYLPDDKRPTDFGAHNASMPEGFLGQMAYPFRQDVVVRE
jgi:sterol desaturase/sphingolipid hydroxylase (fatty acid hydroxylase superfamily)